MEPVKEIKKILNAILVETNTIEECRIITDDGFNIVSFPERSYDDVNEGKLILGVFNSSDRIMASLVRQKTDKIIMYFNGRQILIIRLSENIFLSFISKSIMSHSLILLEIRQQLDLLKDLTKDYK